MQIRLGYELVFRCPQPTPMIFALSVHPSRIADLVRSDAMITEPRTLLHEYQDAFGNRCTRLLAPAGDLRVTADALIRDDGRPDRTARQAQQLPVQQLPDDTLAYLLPSRYCDSDNLSVLAWERFGSSAPGWARVQAICDFVHHHVQFGYEYARSTRSASETYEERQGVCRDFAHLAISLCRCMNVPARYCTGYLGDIGIPPVDLPMDFSGWFEAYLDGGWYTFDARHNVPRIGRVLIARGRDAADVAISTAFGSNTLNAFRVWTDESGGP